MNIYSTNMGNRQRGRQMEGWELEAISSLVGIPQVELNDIYKNFQRVSKDHLLNKYEFRQMYKELIYYSPYDNEDKQSSWKVNRQNKTMADRIFQIFDQDHTGRLTFDEFITIYIMLQNSISAQVRLNFLLDHYSQNNGFITSHMGRRLIQDMSNLYSVNTDYEQVWGKLEATYGSKDGHIPKQAFVEYFTNHPAYSSALYKNV